MNENQEFLAEEKSDDLFLATTWKKNRFPFADYYENHNYH